MSNPMKQQTTGEDKMKSITTRRVFRKFSGINALCNVLSVRHGIRIGAEKSENPDNTRDNVLIISFEFTDGNEKHFLRRGIH